MVVLVPELGDPLGRRILAELDSAGIGGRAIVHRDADSAPAEIDAIARERGAIAAIHADRARKEVLISAADRITGDVTLRSVPLTPGRGGDALVAIETVELLRAALIELTHQRGPEAHTPSAPAAAAAETVSPVEEDEPPRTIALEAGATVLAMSFAASPAFDFHLGLHAAITDLVGVAIYGQIPMWSSRAEDEAGEIKVNLGLAGAGLRLSFLDARGPLRLATEIGAAAVFHGVNGRAEAGYADNEAIAVTAAPVGRLAVSYRVADYLGLRLDLLGGYALAATEVRAVGETVVSYGQPILSAVLALDLHVW